MSKSVVLIETVNSNQTTEEINEPNINIAEQKFVDLVKKSIENKELKKNITLTPEIISIINNIISLTPNTLTDIEKIIIEIIQDGRINNSDIPNLIIVIQKIYQFIYSLKSMKLDAKKRASITGELLKYLIHILVIEKKIKIDEDPEKILEFYKQINSLIDSCVELLSYSKSLKTKRCLSF